MKKTYIAPTLHSVELGMETPMLTAGSGWKNSDSATEKTPFSGQNKNNGSAIWNNDLWGTADKD